MHFGTGLELYAYLQSVLAKLPDSRTKVKVSKFRTNQPKFQELLARHEDPAVVRPPDVVGIAAIAVEPQPALVAFDEEHERVAIRASNRFHGHEKPFAHGLVEVLESQLRSNLVGTKLELKLPGPTPDFLGSRVPVKTEFASTHTYQMNTLGFEARVESGLAEDVISPVTDLATGLLEGGAKILSSHETCAQVDGLPERKILDHHLRPSAVLKEPFELLDKAIRVADHLVLEPITIKRLQVDSTADNDLTDCEQLFQGC